MSRATLWLGLLSLGLWLTVVMMGVTVNGDGANIGAGLVMLLGIPATAAFLLSLLFDLRARRESRK